MLKMTFAATSNGPKTSKNFVKKGIGCVINQVRPNNRVVSPV